MLPWNKPRTASHHGCVRRLSLESLEDRRMLAYAHLEGGFNQGLLHTEADFQRMAAKVAEQAQPWYSGYQALTSEGYAQLGSNPRPLETVVRGGGSGENYAQMAIDMQRAYLLAVRWKVTGDTRYADESVKYLNAWKNTMTGITGGSELTLAAGIYGYQWAVAGEIMRTYDGWSATDAAEFGDWLTDKFAGHSRWFLNDGYRNGPNNHYWANWHLCSVAGLMAIAVYNDDQAMYDEALDHLYNNGGNAAIDRFVYHVHDGNLGQWQESGRDQGHTLFGVSLVGPIMQMAWNQGDDLFSYDNNRFATGAEYIAKYNLGEDVPFEQYAWAEPPWQNTGYHNQISSWGRGAFVPGYELVYNHYANVKGVELPWSEQVVENLSPEGWNRKGDQLGFGTLMYTLDPFPEEDSTPSGLTVVNYEDGVKLNWWGARYADSHNVYRATSIDGEYELIGAGVTDLLTYADHGMPGGEYFYKVTGVIDGAETGPSEVVRVSTTPELIAHLEFDETSGATAADSSGHGVDGTLQNRATWTTGQSGNAVNLSGGGQFVSLPDNVTEDLSDFTIATWVKLDSLDTWSRVFDLGDSNGRYLFLTPRDGDGKVRFSIATNYYHNDDIIQGDAPLPTNRWVHVAVSLSGEVGRLYVDGELVGINAGMNLNPAQVGGTSQNWIGRSQYGGDPYLDGQVDDFRIYGGALSTGQVYELATGQAAPATPPAPAGLTTAPLIGNEAALVWDGVGSVDHYLVKRATSADGPFYTIDTVSGASAYTDSNLTAGQTYYYVVTAEGAGGQSGPSSVVSVTALPALPATPGGVAANALSANEVQIVWSGAVLADSYTVSRAEMSGGPYSVIATGVTDTTYTDAAVSPGKTYYYTVTAANAAGESAPSDEASAAAAELVGWWRFDESSGATAADSSAAGGDAALVSGPTFVDGRLGSAVALDGVDDHVELPDGVVSGLSDFTISVWVTGGTSGNWARVFDFGSGTDSYMFLTPMNGGDGDLRFAIKHNGEEEQINTSATLTPRGWTHLVVTLEDGVGVLYRNGVEVGRNNAMTLTPADLGVTTQNYLGKSQYDDPYLSGQIDDLRLLNRAWSASEVQAMYAVVAPDLPGDYNQDGAVNAADYSVWRDAQGSSVAPYSGADGDGSGRVDQADYSVWRSNYGATSPAPVLATTPIEEASDAMSQAVADPAPLSHLAPLTGDAIDAPRRPQSPLSGLPVADPAAAHDAALRLLFDARHLHGRSSRGLPADAHRGSSADHNDASSPLAVERAFELAVTPSV